MGQKVALNYAELSTLSEHFFLHVFRMSTSLETKGNGENNRLDLREVKHVAFMVNIF